MRKLIDLTGQRFGRLTVIQKASYRPKSHNTYWLCRCDCGNMKEVGGRNLKCGNTKSCGCYHSEQASKSNSKHRRTKTRLFNVWVSMRSRCNCKTNLAYHYYGGRGITVCDEWNDFQTFEKWAFSSGYDETAKPHECTLDRIDCNKGYYPENCRWVNSTVQANNQRSNILISFNGKTQTRAQWAREKGWRYELIRDRIDRYGWSIDRALTEQPRKGKRNVKQVSLDTKSVE